MAKNWWEESALADDDSWWKSSRLAEEPPSVDTSASDAIEARKALKTNRDTDKIVPPAPDPTDRGGALSRVDPYGGMDVGFEINKAKYAQEKTANERGQKAAIEAKRQDYIERELPYLRELNPQLSEEQLRRHAGALFNPDAKPSKPEEVTTATRANAKLKDRKYDDKANTPGTTAAELQQMRADAQRDAEFDQRLDNEFINRARDRAEKFKPVSLDTRPTDGFQMGYNPEADKARADQMEADQKEASADYYGRLDAEGTNSFWRGIKKGGIQSAGLTAGALAFFGDVTGNDEIKENGLRWYQDAMKTAQRMTLSKDFTELSSAADLATWVTENGGYVAYQTAEALLSAGVGGALAKTVGKNVARQELMQAVAMGVNNYRQTLGSVYGEAVEESQKTGQPVSLAKVAIGAAASAAIDTVADKMGLDAITAKGFKGNVASRITKSLAIQAPVQGGTEALQVLPETLGAGKPVLDETGSFSKGIVNQMINEGAVGALGGGGPGVVGGLKKAETNFTPEGSATDRPDITPVKVPVPATSVVPEAASVSAPATQVPTTPIPGVTNEDITSTAKEFGLDRILGTTNGLSDVPGPGTGGGGAPGSTDTTGGVAVAGRAPEAGGGNPLPSGAPVSAGGETGTTAGQNTAPPTVIPTKEELKAAKDEVSTTKTSMQEANKSLLEARKQLVAANTLGEPDTIAIATQRVEAASAQASQARSGFESAKLKFNSLSAAQSAPPATQSTPASADPTTSAQPPVATWTGRSGDGYATPEAAQNVLPSRQLKQPDLQWKVEQMPTGKYVLNGYSQNPLPTGGYASTIGGADDQNNVRYVASANNERVAQAARDFATVGGEGKEWANIQPASPEEAAAFEPVAQVIAKVTGLPGVALGRTSSPQDGLNYGGSAAVNVDGLTVNAAFVAAHEVTHFKQNLAEAAEEKIAKGETPTKDEQDALTIWRPMEDTLWSMVSEKGKIDYAIKIMGKESRRSAADFLTTPEGERAARREMLADFSAKRLTEKETVHELAKRDPKHFGGYARAMIKFFDETIKKFKSLAGGALRDHDVDKHIKDIKRAKSVWTDAMVGWANRGGAKAAPVSGGSSFMSRAIDEHKMDVERQDRATIKHVKIGDDEKSIISTQAQSLASKTGKAERAIASAARAELSRKKAAYPVSNGWAPLSLKGLKAEDGEVELVYQAIPYDFHLDESGKADKKTEQLRVERLAGRVVKEVKSLVTRSASGDQAAKVMLRQADWYKGMRKRLRSEFGGFGDFVADALGATSPNTPVRTNWEFTIEAIKMASEGKYDDIMPTIGAWWKKRNETQAAADAYLAQQLEAGRTKIDVVGKKVKGEWERQPDPVYAELAAKAKEASKYTGTEPLRENGKRFGINTENVLAALGDLWRVVEKGTAPKARNFSGNLIGFRKGATIDVWAARLLRRVSGLPRIPPPAEKGVGGEHVDQNTVGGEFGFGQAVFSKAAEMLRKTDEFKSIGDDDLQAIVWFLEKELWTKNNWTTAAGEGGSFEQEADFAGSMERDRIKELRRIVDSSKSTVKQKTEARQELGKLQGSLQRFVGGLSIQQSAENQGVDSTPTNAEMALVRQSLEKAAAAPELVSFRAFSTLGRYGTDERAFDVEGVTRIGYDLGPLHDKMREVSKRAKQDSFFTAKALQPTDTVDLKLHRPGIEIYFDQPTEMSDAGPVLQKLNEKGIKFFTFITDGRRSTRALSGEMPKIVGVRVISLPELMARYGDAEAAALATADDAAVVNYMQQREDELRALRNRVEGIPGISYAEVGHYEVNTEFKEQYDGHSSGAPQGGSGPVGGPRWAGLTVREGLARSNPGDGANRPSGLEAGAGDLRGLDGQPQRGGAGLSSFSRRQVRSGEGRGRGREVLESQDGAPEQAVPEGPKEEALKGYPTKAPFQGPDPRIVQVAKDYAKQAGMSFSRQTEYVKADPSRGARIAEAYASMKHDPKNPRVKEAYENLIRQTTEQYRALEKAGYKFWLYDGDTDPYSTNPWSAMRDLRETQTMGVFSTVAGFGSDAKFDASENPLLADTGIKWPFGSPDGELRPVLANDLFRAVHDAFGHGIEGAGFRADGEENAWQAHARLFTGSAIGALTSETRGQNSWLNFGPHGEKNRTAGLFDTVFADQKTGLMPEWTWQEGAPVKVILAGEVVTIPDPEKALSSLDAKIQKYKEFLECLG